MENIGKSIENTVKIRLYLCWVKSCPLYFEARLAAHVVNVEFEVATVHNGQHQTKSILGFVGVCQTYLKRQK